MLINIKYENGEVKFIDASSLPTRFRIISTKEPDEIIKAIKELRIRGAPALGAASALCLALVAMKYNFKNKDELNKMIDEYSRKLIEARPTAYNMYYAIKRIKKLIESNDDVEDLKDKILKEALKICQEDIEVNSKIAELGSSLIKDGDRILTHCNTGALATVGIGTALGIIAYAAKNKKIKVYVTETRPVMQGSRLTAWELEKLNIPYKIIPDLAVGYLMKKGEVDKIFVGADRILISGHVINKIGTFSIALIAKHFNIPFYVAAPTSTIDPKATLEDVKIEERSREEVIKIKRYYIAPKKANVFNPSFDITDPELIDGIITEKGIVCRPIDKNIKELIL